MTEDSSSFINFYQVNTQTVPSDSTHLPSNKCLSNSQLTQYAIEIVSLNNKN